MYDGYGDDPDTRKLTSDIKDLEGFDNKATFVIVERVAGSAGANGALAGTAAPANNMLNAGEALPAAGKGIIRD